MTVIANWDFHTRVHAALVRLGRPVTATEVKSYGRVGHCRIAAIHAAMDAEIRLGWVAWQDRRERTAPNDPTLVTRRYYRATGKERRP